MGKIRKEYREDRIESYSYTSHTTESSGSSETSESGTSESESSSSTERKRKHTRKKSKYKKERKRRSESEEDAEYIERERRKKRKYIKDKDSDEISEDDEYLRVEERKHRSKKHKHHHRKHKHKHRRHRRHRSEEEYQQERRRGASAERGDLRKEREEWEERKPAYEKSEKDRRSDKEIERKIKKEEKRSKERGDNRQVKSKWDDDEDDMQYSANRRIKPDPDAEEVHDLPRVKQERERSKKRREREEPAENGRWGAAEGEDMAQNRGEGDQPENEEIQKPNLALSGKLAEDTNTFNGVVIKYSQPPEARKPKRRWRWYIFKGEEDLPFLPLHRQSAYLIGRDRKVADIPTDHPSCSKQHAVLQYRLVTYEREDGTKGRTVKPYILDLDSANGTYVNNRRVESRRFVELIEKDVVKFGYSSREYILLHEGSKGDDADMPDMGVDLSPVSLLRS